MYDKDKRLNSVILRYGWHLLLLFCLVLIILVRLRLAPLPLNMDEGGFGYGAQTLIKLAQGDHGSLESPRQLPYIYGVPGMFVYYSLFIVLFGHSPVAVHLGLLMVTLANVFLIYLLGKRLINTTAGAVAGSCYAVLGLGKGVWGFVACTEPFVLLPALGGLLLLLKTVENRENRNIIGAGILLGLACLVKQTGVVFVACGMFIILRDLWRTNSSLKPLVLFLLGTGLPLCLVSLVYYLQGSFDVFWFYAFRFPLEFFYSVPGSTAPDIYREAFFRFSSSALPILKTCWPIFGLSLLGFYPGNRVSSSSRYFNVVLMICSLLAICYGFYFLPYYFILVFPALALSAGAAVVRLECYFGGSKKFVAVSLVALCLAYPLYQDRDSLVHWTPRQNSRDLFGPLPFPDAPKVSAFIRDHTGPDDPIAVIGSEAELCFYSGRPSASRFIFIGTLLRGHRFAQEMQREWVGEMEASKAKFIVFFPGVLVKPQAQTMLEWLEPALRQDYFIAGVVDPITPEVTEFRWGKEVKGYKPRSRFWFSVYQRKQSLAPAVHKKS